MNKFVGLIEQKIMPVANRIGTQRHMTAIRNNLNLVPRTYLVERDNRLPQVL